MTDTIAEILRQISHTPAWGGKIPATFSESNLHGDPVLHTVCTNGDLEDAKSLIFTGADVNAPGDL